MRARIAGGSAFLLFVLLSSLLSGVVRADVVVFKNGDRVTGQIVEVTEGTLRISTAMMGEVTTSLANVETFSVDRPVVLRLNNGTVIRGTLQTGRSGAVSSTQPATPEETFDAQTPDTGEPAGNTDAQPPIATTTKPAELPPASGVTRADGRDIPMGEIRSLLPYAKGVKYTGNVRAGAVVQRGNSDTDSINAAGDFTRRTVIDRFELSGQYLFGRQRNDDTGVKATTTDNWTATGKYDYFLTRKVYLFGLTRAESDQIAELNLRVQPGAGLGYQWIESPGENFRTEAGLGLTYEDYATREKAFYSTGRLALAYDRRLAQRLKFITAGEYLPRLDKPDQYQVNASAGLRVDLISRSFADFRFEWKFNSDPAPSAQENDFRYLMSFGWEF